MDNWRDLDPDVIAGMFDARLKSVVIRSGGPVDQLKWETTLEWSFDNQVDSELDLSEPGIRLLLGRNGSGKSTLLRCLGSGIAASGTMVDATWRFSIPSEETLNSWSELVEDVIRSETFDVDAWEDFQYLEAKMRLPILEMVLEQLQYLDLDGWIGSVLERSGLSQTIYDPTRGRHHYEAPDAYLGPPESYSPRLHPDLWVRVGLSRRSLNVFEEGDGETFTDSESSFEFSNSAYFLEHPDRAELVGRAMRQFVTTLDCVEFAFDAEMPLFRLLAPMPDGAALYELLRFRRSINHARPVHDRVLLTYPLSLWAELGHEQVASTWYDPRGTDPSHDPARSHESSLQRLRTFVRTTVVDLRGDVEEQLAEMWGRVVDAHLKVVVVRGMVDAPSDVADKSSMTGSPAVGREHIIVDGYDRLNDFLSGLVEDLLELDIGVVGLRAFRAHEAGWSKLPPKPGGFFGSLDFGEEMQGRQILHTPKSKFMSALVLQWQEPIAGNWLEMDAASQGQRDVILMLLAMATSSSEASNAKDHLLLIDEFDQHLHPTVSSKFLEVAQRRAKGSGTRAIMSTHSAPVLAHPSTRQAPRIFARRTVDGAFSYSQSPPETREQLAAELGIDLLAASAYSRLFILVEGEHDEAVVQKLLATGDGGAEITGVEVVNGRGTWAYEGIWNNVLRYHSAPVLVVHDKFDRHFEKAWVELRERAGRDGEELPRWVDTDFHKMRVEIDERVAAKKSRRGDDETDKMLSMVLGIFGGRNGRPSAKDILRLTFHGIDSPDIIRLLPIDHFLKAKTDHGSWDRAEEWWGSQKKGNPWNKEFKNALKLTTDAVRTTLSKSEDGWHPELQRLYDVIRNLHLEGGPA